MRLKMSERELEVEWVRLEDRQSHTRFLSVSANRVDDAVGVAADLKQQETGFVVYEQLRGI